MKIHLDTDIGGDIDDLCALALVLAAPDAELVAVTTVADDGGRRAGLASYVLALAGQIEVPVAAGADLASGRFRYWPGFQGVGYWPEPISPRPGKLEAALALLKQSVEDGAILVGIGQWTNLALLEENWPGTLKQAKLVLMGGLVRPAPPGFPQWGIKDDYNVQLDVAAAQWVLEASHPVLVPLEMTGQTALCRADLPALQSAGPLGRLIAHQAEACAQKYRNDERYGGICPGLPDDLINFQHDPLACAVALGWPGVEIETLPLVAHEIGGLLQLRELPEGRPTRVVTRVDGAAFARYWLDTVTS